MIFFFFFSSRRRHTRFKCDWSSDVCSSDLIEEQLEALARGELSLLVLLLHPLRAAAQLGLGVERGELLARAQPLAPLRGGGSAGWLRWRRSLRVLVGHRARTLLKTGAPRQSPPDGRRCVLEWPDGRSGVVERWPNGVASAAPPRRPRGAGGR